MELHLLRPWWLLAFIPWLCLFILYLRKNLLATDAWATQCDAHLLPYIIHKQPSSKQLWPIWCVFMALFFVIISLIGLSWSHLSVKTYQKLQPRVVLLDLSEEMLQQDVSPSRLERAKFKLHDLFNRKHLGQIGLIAYSSQPFVVSPLTEDGKTIDELVTLLTPSLLPVSGNRLDLALQEAKQLLQSIGATSGHILVLTAEKPHQAAIAMARNLAKQGIYVSIIPIVDAQSMFNKFSLFAHAGKGKNLLLSDQDLDLEKWLSLSQQNKTTDSPNQISIWRDQGRWFIIVALLLLLPLFRRNCLQKVIM